MKKVLPVLLRLLRKPYSNRIQRRTAKSVGPLLFTSLFLAIVILLNIIVPTLAQTDKCADPNAVKSMNESELATCIDALSKAKSQSEFATAGVQKQIDGIKARVTIIENNVFVKQKQIDSSEKELAQIMDVLYQTIRSYYVESQGNCPICDLLINPSISEYVKIQAYERTRIDRDKAFIINTVHSIQTLQESKQELEREKTGLAALKVSLDKVVADSLAYQATLSSQLSQLSERQKSIIEARSGSAVTSVGSVPIGSDFNASIGFKSSAPSNSFAVFSFGAYTHRNGMSQYGAKKQAETKGYKDIIQWYYGHGVRKDEGMPTTIEVQGYEPMDFQTYLYGIAEMPSDWHIEALKAQAVAARTYASRAGKPICTTESCQVFLKSKSDNPPAAWKQAVDDTNKEIIDGDVSAQYSSTAGGYSNTSGWDTTDRTNSGDWTSRAWESQAGSPWFYKSWYRQGYTNSGNSCGRSHPWLSQEEMADIINAWIVRKNPNGADTGRVIPVTINECGINGVSGNPYSMTELREKATNSGGAVTSISSVTTSNNNSGQTTTVHFETNRDGIDISGAEFKETFNVRAPGYISIPQSGFSFFNVEKN